MRKAIKLLAEIQKTGKKQYIEVNLSDKSFTDRELLLTIKKELTTTGINAANLVLTITENVLKANMFMAERFIKALKDMGDAVLVLTISVLVFHRLTFSRNYRLII